MVTVRVCSKLKTSWNRLFLQIKSGRILDILLAFLIKKNYSLRLVEYEMIKANSYPTRTRMLNSWPSLKKYPSFGVNLAKIEQDTAI